MRGLDQVLERLRASTSACGVAVDCRVAVMLNTEVLSGDLRGVRLRPEQVMMCAAHSGDLSSAQKLGLRTGHIGRLGGRSGYWRN